MANTYPSFDDPACPTFRKPNVDTDVPSLDALGPDQDPNTPYVEEWDERDGSPELELRDDGSQAVRTVWVPWDNGPAPGSALYFKAARNILGYPVLVKGGGNFYISRKTPVYYPEAVATENEVQGFSVPGDQARGFLYATQIRKCQGYGVAQDTGTTGNNLSGLNVNRYLAAKLGILYESLPYAIREDDEVLSTGDDFNGPDEASLQRYVTIQPNPSGFQLLLSPGSLYFVAGGGSQAVVGSPPRNVPNFDVEITWHHVPLLAVGLRQINPFIATADNYIAPIEACLGCVNDADFPSAPVPGQLCYQKGTLLLNSVQIRRVKSAIGNRLVDLIYRFAQLPVQDASGSGAQGWNLQFWSLNPPGGVMGWYEAVVGPPAVTSNFSSMTPGHSTFDFADFKSLFRPPQLVL